MSDINLVWSETHGRYYEQWYNRNTKQLEILGWHDARRDSVVPNQAYPASFWSNSQQGSGAYTAEYQHQSYTPASTAQQNTHQQMVNATSHTNSNQQHTQYRSRTGSKLPRGEGPYITGTYTGENLHYEPLDPLYVVRNSDFFFEGRVFAVMWSETASAVASANASARPVDYNTSLSEVKFANHYVHTNARRFVVVRRKHEFCFACPIFTYSKRATKKDGVRASEHAVAYSWQNTPTLLPDEKGITKRPIPVVMADGVPPLAIESRIYFGIHHPVQYNVKVKEIGYVPPADIPTLIGNWREESEGTDQSLEVTVSARQEDFDDVEEQYPQRDY